MYDLFRKNSQGNAQTFCFIFVGVQLLVKWLFMYCGFTPFLIIVLTLIL